MYIVLIVLCSEERKITHSHNKFYVHRCKCDATHISYQGRMSLHIFMFGNLTIVKLNVTC